jgi:hypothetical protein
LNRCSRSAILVSNTGEETNMERRMIRVATAISLSVAIATGARAREATTIEAVNLGATERVHRVGDFYIASQPSWEDFAKAKVLGVESVINFRAAGEQAGFDEKAVVTGLGIAYERVGFTPDSLDDAVFDDALVRLRASRTPALRLRPRRMWSATRSGAPQEIERACLREALRYIAIESPRPRSAASPQLPG